MKKIWAFLLILAAVWLAPGRAVQGATDQSISDVDLRMMIGSWSLDEQIGQLFISRTPADPATARQAVAQYHLGGLILFGSDLTGQTAAQTRAKVAGFQAAATVPLLIATDQEGGTVSRLSSSLTFAKQRFLSPQAAFATGGMAAVLAAAKTQATALKQLGVNWNFAPIADVTSDRNSFIYSRTLGQSYQATAAYIKQVVPAIQGTGVAATLKHFPGYGSAADTHTQFATVTKPLATLKTTDLLPFAAGVAAKVDAIMVTHIVMQALDAKHPASLSHAVITDLLRHQLGYDGVIITDDLAMGAITTYQQAQGLASPDLLAVQAGNDAIMADDYAVGIPQIKHAVESGQLSRAAITDADLRLMKLKRQLNLLDPAKVKRERLTVRVANQTATTLTVTGHVPQHIAKPGLPVTISVAGRALPAVKTHAQGEFTVTLKRTTAPQVAIFGVHWQMAPDARTMDEAALTIPATTAKALQSGRKVEAAASSRTPGQGARNGERLGLLALGVGLLGVLGALIAWRRRV
ncbi:glycoside hydrolase family 3 N-terminal domain-containing protein [Lacticaseibacillus absianus]|uniref:glycoside hydrolase family 3 N-terminal domain-containing protein n=1 Tax=Lacticaseibacillus absianus TaxID=2729623 RepID=UPI0031B56773